MRLLIIVLVVVLLGGSLLAWLVEQEHGYILISVGTTTIEINLWGGVLVVLGLFITFHVLKKILWNLRGLGKLKGLRQKRLQVRTVRGLIFYLEGRWSQARKLLEKSADNAQIPIINYLAAANAAYEEGDYHKVSFLLNQADIKTDGNDLAIAITRAKLSLRSGHFQQALDELAPLYNKIPNHSYILRLQQQAYSGLKDWDSLERLLPKLQRNKSYGKGEFIAVEVDVYSELLNGLTQQTGSLSQGTHSQLWEQIPSKVKKEPRVIEAYARYLLSQKQVDQAEKLVRKSVNRQWDDGLVLCYGDIAVWENSKQITVAEAWLVSQPNNACLLKALGRLSLKAKLWGKARDYFESALIVSNDPVVYVELAQLMDQLGETSKSNEYCRKGLLASVNNPS